MRFSTKLLILTAILELGAGLVLLVLPALAMKGLLGIPNLAPESFILCRIVGVALLALGLSCGMYRKDPTSRSQRGLLWGMLVYNVGICLVLVFAATVPSMSGILLWPGVVVHGVMAMGCGAVLRS